MLQYASKLSDDNEYALLWLGQSLATPNGTPSSATAEDDALVTRSAGQDIVLVGPIDAAGAATLTVTDSAGAALTAGIYADAEVRVGRPTAPGVGYGVVSANLANALTMTWTKENAELATDTVTIANTTTTATVTASDHGLPTGTTTTIAGANEAPYNGLFTITVVDEDTYTYTMASDPGGNATGTITAVPATVSAYLYYRDNRHKTYANVRVLHAYLPEAIEAYPSSDPSALQIIPSFTIDSTVDDYSKLGLFLEHTFVEGISGHGISSVSGGGDATAASSTTLEWTTGVGTVDVFAGALVRVTHGAGVSWGTVTSNTDKTLTITGAEWSGVAYASWTGAAATWVYDIWLPHWFNNPGELTPGPGFLHPTNHSEPLGVVVNRPRGVTDIGYGNGWGAMLSHAWRVSQATGMRISVIPLAVDASYMISNVGTFAGGTHGWKNTELALDWNPSTVGGLFDRIEKILTYAEAANGADGNTKPLKVLAIANMQGEAEATKKLGREQYKNVLPNFYNALQDTIHGLGLNYWDTARKIPITHPNITKVPWETLDTDREVNIAISAMAAKRPYAATFTLDDQTLGDGLHLDGAGEAVAGKRHAAAATALIDNQLSLDYALDDPIIIEICNLALSYIGEKAQITTLNTTDNSVSPYDPSTQAEHCARYFEPARNQLQQRMPWSFNTRRGELEQTEDVRDAEWSCAYGYPDNCVRFFSVLPEEAGSDYSISIKTVGLIRTSAGRVRQETAQGYTEQPFTVEQDDDGYLVVYTNVPNAVGRWAVLIADPRQWSPQFKNALAYQLAAQMAGPVMKGEQGAQQRERLTKLMEYELGHAKVSDGFQHDPKPQHVVPWLAARRSSVRRF